MESVLERTHARTKEEEDQLERSNKKVRVDESPKVLLVQEVEMTPGNYWEEAAAEKSMKYGYPRVQLT